MAAKDEQEIVDGKIVAEFLESDAYKRTEERIRTQLQERFFSAPNSEQATLVWQESQAFVKWKDGLSTTKLKGEVATITKARNEKKQKS
jgi:hypothetical protein